MACVGLAGCFPDLPSRASGEWDMGIDAIPEPEPDGRVPLDGGERDADVGRPDLAPDEELCNGRDDDGDGVTDEGFEVGDPCRAGQGACEAQGETICASGGRSVVCGAVPLAPRPEACNGIDDDCAGDVDEAFPDLDDSCTAGEGICAVTGATRCRDDGQGTECSASAADELRRLETCNGEDDDCDGVVDEGLISACRLELPGLCADGVRRCVDGSWDGDCVGNVSEGERNDVCNGVDDDCDGSPDENQLPQGPVACDPQDCAPPADGCVPRTPCVTQCDPGAPLATRCGFAREVDCDGVDDDCVGGIDDGRVCGGDIAGDCHFLMGWTTRPMASLSEAWGDCDLERGGFDDDISCNRSRVGRFATVSLPGGVDLDPVEDFLGIALRCSAGPVTDYVASSCRVVLGLSSGPVADGSATWGPCPAAPSGADAQRACTSSVAGGGFRPLPLPFDLGDGGSIGVAFVCEDAADPERARAMADAVEVVVAWVDDSAGRVEVDFDLACAAVGDGNPYTGCAVSPADGGFGVLPLTADVGAGDTFAIALRARAR